MIPRLRSNSCRTTGARQRLWLAFAIAALAAVVAGCGPSKPAPAPNGGAQPSATDPSAAATPRFTDATVEAGLDFIQSHGGCGQRYFAEQVASGAAILDVNGDGYPDLYFPQAKPIGKCIGKVKPMSQRLFINDGHGHFKLAPNAFKGVETDYGIGAAVGDYDNDGRPDIYVCCYGKNTLFHNNGDGTFTDVTKKAGLQMGGFSTAAVWFDFDGDGLLDLYVMRYCQWDVAHDLECKTPTGEPDVCNPRIYTPSSNRLFHNNGNGTFTDVTQSAGMAGPLLKRRSLSAAAVDFDGDGKLDLFVANDLGANYLWHNLGGGKFEEVAMQAGVAFGLIGGQGQANMGSAIGDYDDSGRMSVLVTTFSNEPFTLYHNDTGLSFTDVSAPAGIAQATLPWLGFGTGFFDTRNSGRLDLFFAEGHVSPHHTTNDKPAYKQHNQLMLNDGRGNFVEAPSALPADDVRVHRGAVFGSFRNNGKIDVLVTANDDRPTLLRNDTEGSGHWLMLRLVNKYGCCTPIGTRCVATIGKRKLTRAVIGGGSYGGDSDTRVHFGLGSASQVDSLEIRWLDGHVDTLTNVKADQILTLREPK